MKNEVNLINKNILEMLQEGKITEQLAAKILNIINKKSTESKKKDIAVVGMAGQFPSANNIEEFWKNIREGLCSFSDFPDSRKKDTDKLFSQDQMFLLKTKTNQQEYLKGAYLNEIDKFDPDFFNLSPMEASLTDPEQRLFLETAWEAIEDAGIKASDLNGTNAGIFVGRANLSHPVYKNFFNHYNNSYVAGTTTAAVAGRVAYFFNLKGPCIMIDTACSSSLVAVHYACEAIGNNECEIALAGGVQLNLIPVVNNATPVLESPTDQLRPFDKDANGTVWGEGVGVTVLKSLDKAIEDKDHIYAVIKSSAISQDGTSNGISAPNAESHTLAILEAFKKAKIHPETISYVESHGTGTSLGDPIEVKGLSDAFAKYTQKKQFCGIGSLKANVGHGVAASGISSLIKMSMAIKKEEIPPSIHFSHPNPFIDFDSSHFYVNKYLKPWKRNGNVRRASINSFGMSGTNCHIILEEAPLIKEEINTQVNTFLTLSAKNIESLQELIQSYHNFLEDKEEKDFENICYSSNVGREQFNFRLVILADNLEELKNLIKQLIQKQSFENINHPKILFAYHKVVPKAEFKKEHELTAKEQKDISAKADEIIKRSSGTKITLDELNKILDLYICGAKINWKEFYKDIKMKKIPLPTYPFKRKRCWWDIEESDLGESSNGIKLDLAMIDNYVVKTSKNEHIFTSDINLENYWEIREHVVLNKTILVGTSYLETAIEAIKYANKESDNIELSDVVLLSPLMIEEKEQKKIMHITLEENNSENKFRIDSQLPLENEDWENHVNGQYTILSNPELKKCNLNEIKKRFNKSCSIMEELNYEFFDFSSRWDCLKKAFVSEDNNEMFLEVELPLQYRAELPKFNFHPAILDVALNRIGLKEEEIQSFLNSKENAIFLPFFYKKIKVYGNTPEHFYSYMKKNSMQDNNTISLNIQLIDTDGNIFAEFEDYQIKKINKNQLLSSENNVFHEHNWVKSEEKESHFSQLDYIKTNIVTTQKELFKDPVQTTYNNEVSPKIKALALSYIKKAFEDLKIELKVNKEFTLEELMKEAKIVSQHERYFKRILGMLVEEEVLVKVNNTYRVNKEITAYSADEQVKEMLENYSFYSVEVELFAHCGPYIAKVLKGESDAAELIFSDWTLINNFYEGFTGKIMNQLAQKAVEILLEKFPENQKLKILEIGGGTGSSTSFILPKLSKGKIDYTFTDLSKMFFVEAKKKFSNYSFLDYKILDISKSPQDQGIEGNDFDIVIASNVIHATPELKTTINNVAKLLRPKGFFFLLETSKVQWFIDLIFGMTEGWWSFKDTDLRPEHALLSSKSWQNLLKETAFSEVLAIGDSFNEEDLTQAVYIAKRENYRVIDKKEPLLIFKDNEGISDNLLRFYKANQREVFEVTVGSSFKKTGDFSFQISNCLEDYLSLFEDIKSDAVQVLFLKSIDFKKQIVTYDDLVNNQEENLFALINLTKAVMQKKYKKVDFAIVTDYANAVDGKQKIIKPYNASLVGLARSISSEYPHIKCKIVDIDDTVNMDKLISELESEIDFNPIAIRENQRYIMQYKQQDIEALNNDFTTIHPNGLYVITGGASGIGLQVAKYLSTQNNVVLALLNRSKLPEKQQWDKIIEENKDSKLSEKLKVFKEIEKSGSKVLPFSVDITDEEKLGTLLEQLRKDFGEIKGIVHSAGVLKDGFLINKEEETVRDVIKPKIYGTWILNSLTQKDSLDFFIIFSSLVTLFCPPGQGDYAAANSFLDSFTYYRNGKTKTINWTAWSQTGMVSDYIDLDVVFKPMSNQEGIAAFESVLNKDFKRTLAGAINYKSINIAELGKLPILLGDEIENTLQKHLAKKRIEESRQKKTSKEIGISGRSDEEYSEMEKLLAQIYGEKMGFETINIYDDFFSIGGDSIVLAQIHSALESKMPGKVTIAQLFEYPIIANLAKALTGDESSKKEVQLNHLELSAEYLSSDSENKKATNYVSEINTDILNKITKAKTIDTESILLASFLYLLSDISSKELISSNIVNPDKSISFIEIDFNKIENLNDFILLVHKNRLNVQSLNNTVFLDDINTIDIPAESNQIKALFYKKGLNNSQGNISDIFDISVEFDTKQNNVNLVFNFSAKLNHSKTKEFVENYTKTLYLIAEKFETN